MIDNVTRHEIPAATHETGCKMEDFIRRKRPVRDRMINVRVTTEEKDTLERLAPLLGVRAQADVVRLALDCFFTQPKCRAALRRLKGEAP